MTCSSCGVGVALPTDRVFDGVDLGSLLFDGKPPERSVFYHPSQAPSAGAMLTARLHTGTHKCQLQRTLSGVLVSARADRGAVASRRQGDEVDVAQWRVLDGADWAWRRWHGLPLTPADLRPVRRRGGEHTREMTQLRVAPH